MSKKCNVSNMSCTYGSSTLSLSKSSILSRIFAPVRRARPAVNLKDQALPKCKYPLGVGAILVRRKVRGEDMLARYLLYCNNPTGTFPSIVGMDSPSSLQMIAA